MREITRRRLLEASGTAAVLSSAGCLGGSDGDGDGNGNGGSNGGGGGGGGGSTDTATETATESSGPMDVGFSTYFRGGAWITAFLEATEFYAKDQGYNYNEFGNQESAQKQVQDIRSMANQGFDGILVNVWSSEAVNSSIEYAQEQGTPVFTANVDATTDAVELYVAFSNRSGARTAAEQLVKECEEEQPDLTDSSNYQVLNIKGAPEQQITRQRNVPFKETIGETDGFEIVDTLPGNFTRQDAKRVTKEWINSNGPPDAIYSANLSMGLGVLSALKDLGHDAERGEDGHVVQVQLDAGPEVITGIENGYIDAAIDQPNYFYGPIALKYMEKYVNGNGSEEIPEVGTEITASDLTIETGQHKGVELWKEPVWAPAKIVEKDGHKQFQTNSVTVTEENADAEYLWGNIWG